MSLRFIHAADLHVDSPMKGLRSNDPKIAEKVQRATRDAFSSLVDYALEKEVAFVVIAGDIFDGAWDDRNTGLWTIRQLQRLERQGVLVFAVLGNHDAKNKILKNLSFPKNARFFSSKKPERALFPDDFASAFPQCVARADGERVALTGRSYANEKEPKNIARDYPKREPNAFNVGVLHTALGGRDGDLDNYAPTDLATLEEKEYDYWALGHVHQRRTIKERDPWIGYSGVLQARHINEPGVKGFYLVEIDDGELIAPRFVPCDVLRWKRLSLDLNGLDSLDALRERFRDAVDNLLDEAQGREVAVRVELVGRTKLCSELRQARDELRLRDLFGEWASDKPELILEEVRLDAKPIDASETGVLADVAKRFNEKDRYYAEKIDALERGELLGNWDVYRDVEALDYLKKALSACLSELRDDENGASVDFNDPATLRRWNAEALEILIEEFDKEV